MANMLTNPTFAGGTGTGTATDWPGWTRVGMEYTSGQTLPRIRLTSTASGTHTFTSDSIGTGYVGDTVTAKARARQYASSGTGGTKCEFRIMAGSRVVASAEIRTEAVALETQTITGDLISGDEGQPITLQFLTDRNGRYFNLESPELEIVAVGPPPDTTAPSVPTGLTVLSKNAGAVSFAWTASTDDVAGTIRYKVYDDGVRLSPSSTITDTSYQHSGLAEGSTHVYTVKALDVAGNESAASAPLTVTTDVETPPPDTTAPSMPTGLTATSKTQTSVTLSWTASTDDTEVAGYHVHDGGTKVNDALVTGTTFTHTGLSAGSTHSYTVRAGDAAGNWSADSSAVTVTTNTVPTDPDPDPETPPAILRVMEFLGAPDNPALLEIL